MKKFFKYNMGAAICALVLIVLLGIFGGANRTVYTYKNDTERAFSSLSSVVSSDLRKYTGFASQLSAAAKANGCDTSALDKSIAACNTDSPFSGSLGSAADIATSASVVYNELIAKKDVDEQQSRSAKSYYYEMDSILTRLRNNTEYIEAADRYNSTADRYNRAIHSFPTNILTGSHPDAAVYEK